MELRGGACMGVGPGDHLIVEVVHDERVSACQDFVCERKEPLLEEDVATSTLAGVF